MFLCREKIIEKLSINHHYLLLSISWKECMWTIFLKTYLNNVEMKKQCSSSFVVDIVFFNPVLLILKQSISILCKIICSNWHCPIPASPWPTQQQLLIPFRPFRVSFRKKNKAYKMVYHFSSFGCVKRLIQLCYF